MPQEAAQVALDLVGRALHAGAGEARAQRVDPVELPVQGVLQRVARIVGDGRVAHAVDSSLPGWLVVLPRTHVRALDELPPQAADELGRILHDLSAALREVVGCVKTYVMLFAEAEGCGHLHIHLVPRMPDQPADATGPRVVRYLGAAQGDRVPTATMDQIAEAVAASVAARAVV